MAHHGLSDCVDSEKGMAAGIPDLGFSPSAKWSRQPAASVA
jgi:hypothetical protein